MGGTCFLARKKIDGGEKHICVRGSYLRGDMFRGGGTCFTACRGHVLRRRRGIVRVGGTCFVVGETYLTTGGLYFSPPDRGRFSRTGWGSPKVDRKGRSKIG